MAYTENPKLLKEDRLDGKREVGKVDVGLALLLSEAAPQDDSADR